MLEIAFAISLFAAADAAPRLPEPCRLTATAPWSSAGAGYTAQAITDGEDCAAASLTLTLVSPRGRALKEWAWSATVAVRRFYGVPGPAAMQTELEAWIAPAEDKPAISTDLPAWEADAAAPAGYEPAEGVKPAVWNALRGAARPVFCFDDAPGYQTCVALQPDETIESLERRATR